MKNRARIKNLKLATEKNNKKVDKHRENKQHIIKTNKLD